MDTAPETHQEGGCELSNEIYPGGAVSVHLSGPLRTRLESIANKPDAPCKNAIMREGIRKEIARLERAQDKKK